MPGLFPVRLGKPREKSLTWVMKLELPGEYRLKRKCSGRASGWSQGKLVGELRILPPERD